MKKASVLSSGGQFHRAWFKYTVLPVFCLAAFLCCGCSAEIIPEPVPEETTVTAVKLTYMESMPVVDYVVPQQVPNVMVCQAGYEVESEKRAALKGKKLPDVFNLVDADTEEIVFIGRVEEDSFIEDLDLYVAFADFSDWTREGNYYLECEYVGRSYPFCIKDGVYRDVFDGLYRDMIKGCEEKTIRISDMAGLLLVYEWYPDIFADEDYNQIPDVLEKTAAWVAATAEEPLEPGQEALYAATLAKFSYLYQKYDRNYATDCLKKASVVFGQTQNAPQKDADCFYALTELYRATGLYTYQQQIAEYKTYFENHTSFEEEKSYLYGAMTYIATRQKVDVKLCESFVNMIMAQGEEIGDIYREMIYPVNARNNGSEDLLGHTADIACANYVMNNYQYNQIIEEFFQYLRGRNQQSVDFYASAPDGRYLVLFAQLVAVEEL